MGRPSVKEARREEILTAYEACVARYGVEGATLEKIAEEAGLARALLRHHVGNREELLEALVERFMEKSSQQTEELYVTLPSTNRLETLLNWLFDPEYSDPHTVLVSEALIAASATRPHLADQIKNWITDFVEALEKELLLAYKGQNGKATSSVATGVTAIYFNAESLAPLGVISDIKAMSKEAARRLISTLEEE